MLLTISETGLGKRTEFDEYSPHLRGGQGVATHHVTPRTGRVVAARAVTESQELIVVSQSGIVMRTTVGSIRKVLRSAEGVHVMNVGQGDRVASLAVIDLATGPAAAKGGDIPSDDATNGGRPKRRSGNGRKPSPGSGRGPRNPSPGSGRGGGRPKRGPSAGSGPRNGGRPKRG